MKVAYRKSFLQDLRKIRDKALLQRIEQAIQTVKDAASILEIPHLSKMSGASGFYRIRVGTHRLGISISGDELEFIRCMNRRDIYKYFP